MKPPPRPELANSGLSETSGSNVAAGSPSKSPAHWQDVSLTPSESFVVMGVGNGFGASADAPSAQSIPRRGGPGSARTGCTDGIAPIPKIEAAYDPSGTATRRRATTTTAVLLLNLRVNFYIIYLFWFGSSCPRVTPVS